MNSLNLTHLGGLPLTQADMKWLQDTYLGAHASLAIAIGDKVIVSGMAEAGGNVANGWISLNGELLPFIGGVIGTGEFAIVETITNRTFNDGNSKPVRIDRVATFSAGGAYNYSDMVRINSLKEMWQPGDIKEVVCDAAYIAANFDGTGKGINKRVGWAIANGNNGTDDLRGLFRVAYSNTDPDFNIGATGGAKEVTLETNEQGKFQVDTKTDDLINGSGGGGQAAHVRVRFNNVEPPNGGANATTFGNKIDVFLTAAAEGHDNLPPFKAVLVIQKL